MFFVNSGFQGDVIAWNKHFYLIWIRLVFEQFLNYFGKSVEYWHIWFSCQIIYESTPHGERSLILSNLFFGDHSKLRYGILKFEKPKAILSGMAKKIDFVFLAQNIIFDFRLSLSLNLNLNFRLSLGLKLIFRATRLKPTVTMLKPRVQYLRNA